MSVTAEILSPVLVYIANGITRSGAVNRMYRNEGDGRFIAIHARPRGFWSPRERAPSASFSVITTRTAGPISFSVARTWLWLGNILDWYGDLNRVRNEFFVANGLLGPGIEGRMPASTGIGIGPCAEAACCMELVAVLSPGKAIDYLDRAGNQNSAFDYGSAFSRATIAPTPTGRALYISGTASIDKAGGATHIDSGV